MLMKLLFVEDDQAIAMGLVYTLKKEGYEVVWCDHKRSALQQLDQQTFDLLLLDVGLPDGSGYDICTYAKSRQDVPVLFLTALDDEGNVVMGLDMGGDDYITKPFRINELLSRMRSVQRRYHRQEEDIVQIQYLSIYPKQGKVYREQEEVLLTALEYRLLMVFINHPQQVLSRSQLLEGIWDAAGDFVNDNTLTVYIKRLREKAGARSAESVDHCDGAGAGLPSGAASCCVIQSCVSQFGPALRSCWLPPVFCSRFQPPPC